jgi:tetratricopeptide (TPR) repeat protein
MHEHHPDRQTLERFSRGGSSASEERWIEDHLRTGCGICQREVDDLLIPTLDATLLAEAGVASATPVTFLRDELEGEEQDAAWDRVFSRLEQRLALIGLERGAAPRLVDELTRHAPAERASLIRAGRRFRTLAVCELLIERSFEEGPRDESRAIELAELAIEVASQLDGEYYGRSVVQDLQARAWAYLGNARRIAFDLAGAEEALSRAERIAERGSADPLEEARILDLKAALLSDQGRFEKAADLLDMVIEIYTDVREPHRKGRALISKGTYLGCAGLPEEAIELISEGLSLIDEERDPLLALTARHNLAWFLNDDGRGEEALRQLERFRSTYRESPDPWTELRLAWLEGRIALSLGRWERAEERLREARQRFLAEAQGYDASLVTLDLANLYLKQGRAAEVRQLAREMLPVFLSRDIHHQALAALSVFQRAAEMDGATPLLVDKISGYLMRARRNPRLAFQEEAAA